MEYDKAFLDLNVKITEIAGDLKLVLRLMQDSDEKHREHARRLDDIETKALPEINHKVDTALAQAITPRKVWAALGVLSALMGVGVAIIALIVQ